MRQLLRITATFALALVFSAGMAFGQENNDAVVNQTGNSNEVTLTQEAFPAGTFTIGPFNDTYLDQRNDSEADIRQVGGSKFGKNLLTGFGGDNAFQKNGELNLLQGFADNTTRLDQVGGVADLLQQGSSNLIELRQGTGSEATVNQGTPLSNPLPPASNGNRAFLDQSANDFADVLQAKGSAFKDPRNDRSNFLDLNQNNGSNSATVEQIGTTQNTDQFQNVARLSQSGGADAEVYQDGIGHRLSGTTGKGSFATQQNGSFLRLNQTDGNNNTTALDQKRGKQIARLDQNDGSTAEVLQKNGGGPVANRLSGTTGKGSFVTQNNSELDLLQNGNNNWTAIDQFAEGSTATVTQNGNGNIATITQQGTP